MKVLNYESCRQYYFQDMHRHKEAHLFIDEAVALSEIEWKD